MARRVLHMHFGKEGGAERFFVNLVTAFGEAGVEQQFITRPGRVWADEIAGLGPVIHSHYRRIAPSSIWLTWRVRRLIDTWQPHAIMAWMSRSSRLIPDMPGIVKLTRLGDYPRHLKHFRFNDLIVPNTPGIAARCQELGWQGGLEVISNFVRDVTPEPVPRAAMDTPEGAFVVAGSGRFIRRKGFATLVEAVARQPDTWLWLIGDGPDRDDLATQAEAAGLAGRLRFTGWVEEPLHHIAAADCFVMPSRHEPLGNVLLEAWAAGTPSVTTASEGPSWFASDGRDCLIVPIDDAEAMEGAITRIRTDSALAQSLVAGGQATLSARFTREAVVGRYLEIFDGKL
ncbi:MAG: glycosyltransferase [Pseudomonadota bacterium]